MHLISHAQGNRGVEIHGHLLYGRLTDKSVDSSPSAYNLCRLVAVREGSLRTSRFGANLRLSDQPLGIDPLVCEGPVADLISGCGENTYVEQGQKSSPSRSYVTNIEADRSRVNKLVTERVGTLDTLQISLLVKRYEAISCCGLFDAKASREFCCGHCSARAQDKRQRLTVFGSERPDCLCFFELRR
jgi:hypothetical protein